MKYRDPFSSAAFFATSLVHDPVHTVEDTWKGIQRNGELGPFYKVTTPALGVSGLGLVFAGVATADPVAVGFGAFTTAQIGGRYLELGRSGPIDPKSGDPWDQDDDDDDDLSAGPKDRGGNEPTLPHPGTLPASPEVHAPHVG